jgi:hypothetical protein
MGVEFVFLGAAKEKRMSYETERIPFHERQDKNFSR